MQKLLIECNGCNLFLGCIVGTKERLCDTCTSWNTCWLDTNTENLETTSRLCKKCFMKWYGTIKHRMSKEAIQRIDEHVRRHYAQEEKEERL